MRYIYILIFLYLNISLSWGQTIRDSASRRKTQVKEISSIVPKQSHLSSKDSLKIDRLSKIIYQQEIHENYIGQYKDLLLERRHKRTLDIDKTLSLGVGFYTVKINFATDRNILNSPDSSNVRFGSNRSTISYGSCAVSIPYSHEIGETESTYFLDLFGKDKEKYMYLLSTHLEIEHDFFSRLSKIINKTEKKNAFIFIHGYNVSFDDAALRVAQLYRDIHFTGIPVLYSWPSRGNPFEYSTDEANIEWTQRHLENFLLDFFKNTNIDNLYIIAHSMGNRAMSRAICAVANSNPVIKEKIKEVILAAPDIDAETFTENIAPTLLLSCKRITIYGSASDHAIQLSKYFHSYKRLGTTFQDIPLVSGIDFIDATGIDTNLLGHSYIGTNRTILQDIAGLINNKLDVSKRFGLDKVDVKPVSYWRFRK